MISKSENEKILAQIDAAGGGVNVSKYEFFYLPKWLSRRPLKELRQSEKILYSVIKSFQAINGRYCYPAVSTLADSIGATKETVNRLTRNLIKAGLLGRIPRKRPDGTYMTSIYWVKEREDWIKDWEVVNGKNIPDDPSSDDRGSVTDDNRKEEVENRKEEIEYTITTYGSCSTGGDTPNTQPVFCDDEKDLKDEKPKPVIKEDQPVTPQAPQYGFGVKAAGTDLMDLLEDTPTNAFLRCYHELRPGAGHPLRQLTDQDNMDVREIIGYTVEAAGLDESLTRLKDCFAGGGAGIPSTVKQAALFVRKPDINKDKRSGKKRRSCPTDNMTNEEKDAYVEKKALEYQVSALPPTPTRHYPCSIPRKGEQAASAPVTPSAPPQEVKDLLKSLQERRQ